MTTVEAITTVYNGGCVKCTQQEYENGIRTALQDKAGQLIDQNQAMRAMIMLEEVKRLDNLFS